MVTSVKEKILSLSVILDEHLTWKKHVQIIENKASKMLMFFMKQVN